MVINSISKSLYIRKYLYFLVFIFMTRKVKIKAHIRDGVKVKGHTRILPKKGRVFGDPLVEFDH